MMVCENCRNELPRYPQTVLHLGHEYKTCSGGCATQWVRNKRYEARQAQFELPPETLQVAR